MPKINFLAKIWTTKEHSEKYFIFTIAVPGPEILALPFWTSMEWEQHYLTRKCRILFSDNCPSIWHAYKTFQPYESALHEEKMAQKVSVEDSTYHH